MYTAEQYAKHIEQLFEKDNCKVIDFYVIPDYTEFLSESLDPKFGRYCKQEYTQHQFIFEAVSICEDFPFGCKTTYRAYSENAVVEIREEENQEFPGVNMVAYQAKPVRTYPLEVVDNKGNVIQPGGIYHVISNRCV